MKRILSLLGVILLASAASAGLPGGGKQVEYLELTNSNSYFDSGWRPDQFVTNVVSITASFSYLKPIWSATFYLLASELQSPYNYCFIRFLNYTASSVRIPSFQYFYGTNSMTISTIESNRVYDIKCVFSKYGSSAEIGGQTYYTPTSFSSDDITLPSAYIFAEHTPSTTLKTTSVEGARIYHIAVNANGTNVLDCVAAVITNTPCLYDSVQKRYLYNIGTVPFMAGPVVMGGGGGICTPFEPLGVTH